LEEYIGSHRPLWIKLALFPLAWGAKCHTLSKTDLEFAVSRHDLDILQGCSGPLASRQRLIYHSAVRENEISPGPPERQPVILCVGAIGPRKGQRILIEAFNRIAGQFVQWRLALVGRWEEQTPYSIQVRSAIDCSPFRDRIDVPGRVSHRELRQKLRESAIFAMPSLEEGLGLSLQEALLSGCPAIGSRTGGIPELIDHEVNGLLVPPGDPESLARALADLMENPSRRLQLGNHSRESVLRKGMTLEAMVRNYKAAYREVLNLP
jgi:glycosyltransferase involved in cell wall biosynthesis